MKQKSASFERLFQSGSIGEIAHDDFNWNVFNVPMVADRTNKAPDLGPDLMS